MSEYTLFDLVNGKVAKELNTTLYPANYVASLLGISKGALSKRLSSTKYAHIKPLRISNILLLTKEQFHQLFK